MEPVRVKLYGLVSVTKRGYVTQQVIALALLVFLLALSLAAPEASMRSREEKLANTREAIKRMQPSHPEPARDTELPAWKSVLYWLVDNLRWIVLIAFTWFAVETVVVLRRFAQKSALRRAQSTGPISS